MNATPDLAARVDALLAPLAGDSPGGRDVRYEGDFDRIAEARRDDRPGLPRGVWARDVKPADWRLAERLCCETLAERSKDLRVACWLCEAWVHLHGFHGLAQGLTLIAAMCERYWNTLHPQLDDGDPATRISAIEWLNARLPIALRQVPLLADPAQPGRQFDWTQQLQARRLETIRHSDAAAAQRAEANGMVTLAFLDACLRQTPLDALQDLDGALRDAADALSALDTEVDCRCGRDAPGLSAIRDVIEDVANYIGTELRSRVESLESMPISILQRAPVTPAQPAKQSPLQPPVHESFSLQTRAQAYRMIDRAADFLLQSEPHSPVPYILKYMVNIGSLSLLELESVLRDGGSNLSVLIDSLGMELSITSEENEVPAES